MTAEASRAPRAPVAIAALPTLPALLALPALMAAACVGVPSLPPPGEPGAPPDAALRGELLAAERGTSPQRPARLAFSWRAREPDFRGEGAGVARVAPPHMARLDLFLDNGETAAAAALVGDELRVPDAEAAGVIPPPPLLWAALGVYRPGSGAELVRAGRSGGELVVEHRLAGGATARFRLRGGAVAGAEIARGGSVAERVTLAAGSGRAYPARATYRNFRDFRELSLALETVEDVDDFPPETWMPAWRPRGR